MTIRPTRIAQTSKEAQKSYKKNGPRIPEREKRQLERLAELDNRAAKAREQEERRKGLKKKREEKEKKEKEVRKQLGVGLATQVCGYSHTQKRLKNGMEAFLGLKKKEAIDKTKKEEEEAKLKEKLEAIVEDMEKEPWDDSEGDDAMVDLPMVEATEDVAGELPMVDTTIVLEGDHWVDDDSDDSSLLQAQDPPTLDTRIELEGDHWIDDDLDDGSLLEAHDLVMSDPINEPLETPQVQVQVLPPLPAPITIVTKPAVCKSSSPQRTPEDSRFDKCNDEYVFSRLHGPINKAIEDSLSLLPEPLIELLSQDTSLRESWNPAPSLLHKLNPTGLPPHRLRLKIGCIVSLLRDLNNSSQLSKSSHLRVLRIENDWLECLVVDGQLEGTKAFLSRIAFPAKYRNEDRFAFQRKQFPIRISTKHAHLMQSRVAQSSAFRIPSVTGQVPRPLSSFKKPLVPVPKPKPPSKLNTSFKLPGLPLSRATKSPASLTLTTKSDFPSVPMDGWDDFLDSATQIARDLSSDDSIPAPRHKPTTVINDFIPLSTQDLDFDMDDLEDVVQPAYKPSNLSQHVKAATMSKPRKATYVSPPNPLGRILGHKTYPKPSMASSPRPPQVSSNQKASPAIMPTKSLMPPPSRPPTQHVNPKSTNNSTPIPAPPSKRSPSKQSVASKVSPAPKSFPSFSEFGLSTQDAESFFDDDDDDEDDGMASGSPLITV